MEQLGYGLLVGGGIGLVGGWMLGLARRKGWMAEPFQQIGVVAVPLLCLVPGETTIRLAIIGTVLLSIFVHGLSATPGIDLYARGIASLDSGAPELTRNDKRM